VSDVEWLLRDASEAVPLRLSELAIIDDEHWRATIERVYIGPSLRVFLTNAEARRDITVEPVNDRTDQWIGSQVTIAGRADIDFLDGQRTYTSAEQAILFRLSGLRAAYTVKSGTRFQSAGYVLDLESIRRLFDSNVPAVLHALFEPVITESRVVAMRCHRLMRNIAGTLFAYDLNGPLRSLMLEGVVLQLIAAQAAAAGHQPASHTRAALSQRERDAVAEARQRLLADMRAPPTLGELAVAVGLTEKRLNAGFRAVFGATAFETLRSQRLEHARIVCEAGELPLKEIASRVGYNHVTNFINAFTARYGAPPRQYRNGAPMALEPTST
jgi:AraC-like DNA-binding protein